MHDFKGVLDDAHGQHLLAVVAAVHHERVGQSLNDGALGLPEALHSKAASRVRQVLGVLILDANVVLVRER